MNDVIVMAIIVGFFGLAAGYVIWCERIVADGRGPRQTPDRDGSQ